MKNIEFQISFFQFFLKMHVSGIIWGLKKDKLEYMYHKRIITPPPSLSI